MEMEKWKVFSTESKEQHLKLKTNKNYYVYEGFTSSLYLILYAKVFLVISTIYSAAFVIQMSFLRNWDKI